MFELVLLGVTFAAAAILAGAPARRKNAAARVLSRYAQSRGLAYEPPSKDASPRIFDRDTQDSVALAVDLYRLTGEVRTRVSAEAQHGLAPPLSVAKRGAFAWKNEPAIPSTDPEFDRVWVINAATADDAERLPSLDLARLATCDGVWLATSGARISLSWWGVERDPLVLDAARRVVLAVARWHRTPIPYR